LNDITEKSRQINSASENKENLFSRNSTEALKKPECPQAVLSIFKIETQKSALLRKKPTINSILGGQEYVPGK